MAEQEPGSNPAQAPDDRALQRARAGVGGRYAKYVLVVLVIVYVFNFVDRQIVSILAEEIKADIGVTDAQLGFLYGTAFAVFYAVFGIPLGRLADVWIRKNLIAIGLFFWSMMTALSGTAREFNSLAAFRIGVGVGEASATPAAFSMLSDSFSPRVRATVLSVYSSGVYIGAGLGVFLGGILVDGWHAAFPDPAAAPLGLKAWQAAFMIVGLPGVAMAAWVWTLKEPVRGASEGLLVAPEPHPFRIAFRELVNVLPGLTWLGLARAGGGTPEFLTNFGVAAGIGLLAAGLIGLTGDTAQWVALGLGVYAAASWVQILRLQDPATFRMVFGSRTLLLCMLGFPCIAFVTYGIGFWAPPFFIRVHDVSASQVGIFLGLPSAIGGWLGVTLGGVLADRLRSRTVNARLWIGVAVPFLALPLLVLLVTTPYTWLAYTANFLFSVVSPLWVGPAATTINDLLMPRMRAVGSAFYILMVTFIGLALGPYTIGQLSDALVAGGDDAGDALSTAMLYSGAVLVITLVTLRLAVRYLPEEERTRLQRARAAGESVPDGTG